MEDRINYALKNFLNDNFLYDSDSSIYELLELADEGKSRLTVHVGTTENICVKNYDKFPKWGIINNSKKLHLSKCVDHFIFKQNQLGTWELHIFEMKTSVGFKTWSDIKYKLRSSYLSIKAIAVYLGIKLSNENITVYTTYENDEKMEVKNMTDPKVILPRVGGKAIDAKKDEWDAGVINVPVIVSESNPYDFYTVIKLRHRKIHMNRVEDDFLENMIYL
jgi:hypothetical protein